MIPRKNTSRPTRGSDKIPLLGTKRNLFQNSYFLAAIKEWIRLDIDIRKSDSISIFETTLHFLLYCPNFMECRNTLLSKISEINSDLITRSDLALIETILFGDNSSRILDATIAFIVTSKRFDNPLLV